MRQNYSDIRRKGNVRKREADIWTQVKTDREGEGDVNGKEGHIEWAR